MKPVRVRGTLRLKTETGKGMWESHQITAFQVLGKEKALTVFANAGLVFIWSTGCTACGWLSPMLGCIVRSRPSLTVYIIACIDLGVLRHHATPCDIVCQLLGFDSRQAGFQGLSAGHDEHSATRRTARYPAKAIEHGKDHGQRIDQEYHL